MKDYKLSVLVPGIRTENWKKLYRSIPEAFHGEWEIIFVGPYELPYDLKQFDNIKYIEDWGSPIRCQQRALYESSGEYITWAADDGFFLKGSLDIAFSLLEYRDPDVVIMGKYKEGSGDTTSMEKVNYYLLNNHEDTKSKNYPESTLMLNVGVVSRKLLIEHGGWDAESFEVCPHAYNDLSIRLQLAGCKFIVQDEVMFICSHMPGHSGDHGPIHDGQQDHDRHVFGLMWKNDMPVRKVNVNNWEKSPGKWNRRFGSASV
jgi:hypothetical protein